VRARAERQRIRSPAPCVHANIARMRPLRICLTASEAAPFAKTGGLADVVTGLGRWLGRRAPAGGGHDVRLFLPYYKRIADGAIETEPLVGVSAIDVRFPNRTIRFEYAHSTLDLALKTYGDGQQKAGLEMLGEIQQAVELSQESLEATGKLPSKKPKHFKRAEIETRKLLRELGHAETQVNFDHREHIREVYERVEQINRELLLGIMTKPKK
jgi:hypothetical protein